MGGGFSHKNSVSPLRSANQGTRIFPGLDSHCAGCAGVRAIQTPNPPATASQAGNSVSRCAPPPPPHAIAFSFTRRTNRKRFSRPPWVRPGAFPHGAPRHAGAAARSSSAMAYWVLLSIQRPGRIQVSWNRSRSTPPGCRGARTPPQPFAAARSWMSAKSIRPPARRWAKPRKILPLSFPYTSQVRFWASRAPSGAPFLGPVIEVAPNAAGAMPRCRRK